MTRKFVKRSKFLRKWYYENDITKYGTEKMWKAYGTKCSQAVPHPSTILARRCLTSVIRRERVCSSWYGRRRWVVNFTDVILLRASWGACRCSGRKWSVTPNFFFEFHIRIVKVICWREKIIRKNILGLEITGPYSSFHGKLRIANMVNWLLANFFAKPKI